MIYKLEIKTDQRRQLINITKNVADIIRETGIQQGICVVYVPHTTCAVTINESADPDVQTDLLYALERMVPNTGFLHFEENSDAHMQASLLGCSQSLIIDNNTLVLGRWQAIYFAEFDGARRRNCFVRCIEDH